MKNKQRTSCSDQLLSRHRAQINWDGDGAKGDKAAAGAASSAGQGAGAGGVGGKQDIDAKLKSSEWRKEVNPVRMLFSSFN